MIARAEQVSGAPLEPLTRKREVSEIAEILARGYLRLTAERPPDLPQLANGSSIRESDKSREIGTISLDNLAAQSDECVQMEMFREVEMAAKEAG